MKKISTNRFFAFLLALVLVGGHLCHPAFFPAARAADAMTIRNVTEQSDMRVWVRFNNKVDQVYDENSTRTDSLASRGHIEGFAIVDADGNLIDWDGNRIDENGYLLDANGDHILDEEGNYKMSTNLVSASGSTDADSSGDAVSNPDAPAPLEDDEASSCSQKD